MPYDYATLNTLRSGSYFMFASGGTINLCYHKERKLMVCYRNVVTGKSRRISGFKDVNKETRTARVRYIKMLDGMFDKYFAERTEEYPF